MKEYEKATSFSQNTLFENCPRTWYMKYIQKIPGIEDLVYAHRGNVVHHCLENYYPDKKMPIPELKQMFNKEWKKFKLDESKLKNKKDETWLMILNGINLDLYVTSTELKIYFPDVVAYIDVVNSRDSIITDWKTSTRSYHNEEEYIKQVKFYAWLYYRKFKELPKYTDVKYLKYSGTKSELGCKPTMEDIKEIESWHHNVREKMQYYIDNPDKLPQFNQDYFFCPYKHLWNLKKDDKNIKSFIITIYGNFFYVEGMDDFLKEHFDNKYSYEKKSAYFIKQKYPNANTTIRLFSKRLKRFPIGFLKDVMQSLHDYAVWKKKTPVIKIVDKKYLDKKILDMPDKLLSGKVLRPYQIKAVESFTRRNKVGILELTTGAGKSLIMTEIVRRLRVKTLVVIDKRELLYQLKDTLETNLGMKVGIVGDGKKDIQDITVATIQTLMRNLNEYKEYLQEVRFLCLDETHKAASKSYYKLGSVMKNTEFRAGFSATAFRDDGNDMMMNAVTGYKLFSLTGQELIDKGYLMKPKINFIFLEIPTQYKKEMEFKSSSGLINSEDEYSMFYPNFIVNNYYRNYKIKTLCDKHKKDKTLILVKQIEHGEKLEEMIPNSLYIYGGTKKTKRDKALEDFKNGDRNVLIATISIFAEGVDIPSLTVIINAAANRGDVKSLQVLGRVLRTKEGKDKAIYYDFMDSYKFFSNASKDRMKIFRKEGHSVEVIKEDPNVLSLCSSCYCMTHTLKDGKCGKCKGDKK